MIETFDEDPFLCPHCHRKIELVKIWHADYEFLYHYMEGMEKEVNQNMLGEKELDEMNKEFLKSLQDENPFGLNEEMEIVIFKCRDCREEDDVPDFVVQDFQVDLSKNEEVEIECQFCGGTMRREKKNPE